MSKASIQSIRSKYPVCCGLIGQRALRTVLAGSGLPRTVDEFTRLLEGSGILSDRPYLKDLAEFEEAYHRVLAFEAELEHEGGGFQINPSLEVIRLSWRLID
ncbi:MAG: hypothetical protein GF392_00210, partial [Candidatus Omnitrophica bacterium]|nr:hypothetical protein [Candidatus Omnitrophota bacterium]